MNKQNNLFRVWSVALILVLGALMPACGGGGSSGPPAPPVGPLTARFTPSNANPGADTINMTGTSSGANFSIRINVTDVQDFFGAGFRVSFNPASARFVGFTPTGSFLEGLAVNTELGAVINPANNAEVLVTATIQDNTQPPGVDVTGTRLLITLNFQATTTVASNPFNFVNPMEVQECPTQGGACSEISGMLTWSGGTMSASR